LNTLGCLSKARPTTTKTHSPTNPSTFNKSSCRTSNRCLNTKRSNHVIKAKSTR
jgi:hypothetical protein